MSTKTTYTRQPIIYFTEEVNRQVTLYTQMAKGEISWIGTIEKHGEFDFLVGEIFLIKQETTSVKTQFDDEDMAMFLLDYNEAGKDLSNLKLWLHTHNNFAVSWSTRDEKTINNFHRSEFMVSVVTNKFGDFLARIDIFRPLRLTLENVQVAVLPSFSEEEIEKAANEITEKVKYTEPPKVKYKQFLKADTDIIIEPEEYEL